MDVSLFGALYRQERTRKNLTMDDITQKTGITKAFLSMLENGKVADIKLSNIEKLVGAIDYTPVQFLMLLERVEENGVFKKKPHRRPVDHLDRPRFADAPNAARRNSLRGAKPIATNTTNGTP